MILFIVFLDLSVTFTILSICKYLESPLYFYSFQKKEEEELQKW